MKRALLALCVVVLAACGPGASEAAPGQVAACEKALRARFDALSTTGVVPDSTRPAECVPLSDAQLAEVGRRLTAG